MSLETIDAEAVAVETAKPKRGNAVATVEARAVAPAGDGAAMFSAIERIMTDPNASVERANQAFEFYQKVEADRARKMFDAAVAEAKAEIKPVARNATGHNAKKYADFAAIAREVDPVLGAHGLTYRFRSDQGEGGRISVTCRLAHKAGHAEETTLSGPPDTSGSKNAIQALGSTLTYLQRYSLVLMLGLAAANDDDGKASGGDLISDEQADTILELLALTNTQPQQFLAWAKVENVSDIKAKDFDKAVGMLKAKQAKLAKKGSTNE